MKLKTHLCLFVVLVLLAFNLNAKPRTSLFMNMAWVDGIVYAQPTEIHIEIVSQISSEKMRFSLDLPDGVTVIDGELEVEYKVEKGRPLSLDFTLMFENNVVGDIKAEASIGDSSHVFFRATKTLPITQPSTQQTLAQKLKARPVQLPPFRHTERNGVKLREYTLP